MIVNPYIPKEIIEKYGDNHDMDTLCFLQCFNEEPGSKILEIGSHDEAAANILTDSGYKVIGIDLRQYDPNLPPCNYQYIRGDFNNLPKEFLLENWGTFDAIFSLSAIEHFGLATYSEGKTNWFYDVIALRQIWNLLRDDGTMYLTVPFGRYHLDIPPHWRVYSKQTLEDRLIQDFTVLNTIYLFSADTDWGGNNFKSGDMISEESAMQYPGTPPNLTVFVKLKKISHNRIAPEGR